MSKLTLDEAKAYLKEGKVNLYDHLSDVILRLLTEKPQNATGLFEQLSCTIRQERFKRPTEVNNGTEDNTSDILAVRVICI